MYLTAYSGSLLGPISKLLGWIMDKIYVFFANLGIENVALSIIIFTIFIYLCLYPLTYKQQKFSILSQKMQPELNAVQEKYKGKKDQASMQAMQNETTAVYDKYGVSPTGSCINLIIQMPILLALYRVFSNIPAYIGSVRKIFTGTPDAGIAMPGSLVDGIMSTAGYADKLKNIWRASNNRTISVNLNSTDPSEMCNYIVDILYKFKSDSWDSLAAIFSKNCADSIVSVRAQLEKVNNFIILNISETPWEIMKSNFRVSLIVCFAAAAIPILSYISQLVSIKLMPSNDNNDNSQMGQSMKAMNNVMPLFSLFLCFTVPVGLGIYWVMGALIRAVQQVFLNKHFAKIDLDEIIEKNKDRAARRAAKRGERADRISQMATMNTRSISEKANTNVVVDTTAETKEVTGEENSDIKNDNNADTSPSSKWPEGAPPAGSLAAKANLVKEFNERNNK